MTATNTESLQIVQSKLFSSFPKLTFGISTRLGGISQAPFGLNLSFDVDDDEQSVHANRELFFGKLNIPLGRLATPKQVHGNTIQVINRPGTYDACDGLLTDSKDLFLAISVADCLPIFLFDSKTESFAAIHSGWKGSALKILNKGLQLMQSQFGCKAGNLFAFIGQSAGECCYEVGEEVAKQFDDQFVVRRPSAKPHLNLKSFNTHLLLDFGLREDHIEVVEQCTICTPQRFHSFRRDGSRSGRMMGVIGLQS